MVFPSRKTLSAVATLSLLGRAAAGSVSDIKHVVLFMQENRAFDHYFGTLAGVRGFKDPNVQVNSDGKSVWNQIVTPELSNETDWLLPWQINYLGGTWDEATQCMVAGDNGWTDNHAAYNDGLNNAWARNNTPWSWGYFTRDDIPVQYAIADGWTVGDMYQEGVIASTNPNRVTWSSGTINAPGSPGYPNNGGTYIDNYETPGCESPLIGCYPLQWETIPELWQNAGVNWQLYQGTDNFDDNPLAWFKQYQDAANNSALAERGTSFLGLDAFYDACADGSLPTISYIIGPTELSEHPPYAPRDGAWLQKQVVDAVTSSPLYNETALIISWDETGGFGDHVTPFHSPEGTPGEWMEDPEGLFGYTFTGPGFRLPFYIISPWTRGGAVFTERSDHNSQIMFVEQWLESLGYKNVQTPMMPEWRRQEMSNLMNAFDFDHPDYSIPSLPDAPAPHTNSEGVYDGSSYCESLYPVQRPPVPYSANQSFPTTESGFKSVRGKLSEGRYLVFEASGQALANANHRVTTSAATAAHDPEAQRWIIHEVVVNGEQYLLQSAVDNTYVNVLGQLQSGEFGAAIVTIKDLGNGQGYTVQLPDGQYVGVNSQGALELGWTQTAFSVYSVTY